MCTSTHSTQVFQSLKDNYNLVRLSVQFPDSSELPAPSYTYRSCLALSPGQSASDPVSPAAPRTATLGYRSDPVSPHPCRTNFHPYQNTIISPHSSNAQESSLISLHSSAAQVRSLVSLHSPPTKISLHVSPH